MSALGTFALGAAFGAGLGVSIFGTYGARAVATTGVAALYLVLAVTWWSPLWSPVWATVWALLGVWWAFLAWRDVQIRKLDRRRKAAES